jgi:hypothetical protein
MNASPCAPASTRVVHAILRKANFAGPTWYGAWERTGDRVSELAHRTKDPISRGRAHLRAHNYFRTAEFLLAPHDPRRASSWKKNIEAFYSVQRTQRGQVRRLDPQHRSQVPQQHRRHGTNAVERPTAHAYEADMQRQTELVVVAAPPRDHFELIAAEAEEGLQLELGELTREVAQAKVGRSANPASPPLPFMPEGR